MHNKVIYVLIYIPNFAALERAELCSDADNIEYSEDGVEENPEDVQS